MSEFAIATVVCLSILGGAALGGALRAVLPPEHMNDDSRQIVNVAIGLIATLSALVLGLLVASAKSSFDARNEEIKQSATKQGRWLLVEGDQSSIPRPFLVVLSFWLAAIFAALGLFAPRNATVYAVIVIGALSVSTAVLMILEMDQPFEGFLQIPSTPLVSAVDEMKR